MKRMLWVVAVGIMAALVWAMVAAEREFARGNQELLALCYADSTQASYGCQRDYAARKASHELETAVEFGAGLVAGSNASRQ